MRRMQMRPVLMPRRFVSLGDVQQLNTAQIGPLQTATTPPSMNQVLLRSNPGNGGGDWNVPRALHSRYSGNSNARKYGESTVFSGKGLPPDSSITGYVDTSGTPAPVVGWNNQTRTTTYPIIGQAQSVQALAQNVKRAALAVQNNDTANILYVAFGVAANASNGFAVQPQQGILLDVVCPSDAVNFIWADAGAHTGVVLELTNP